MTFETFDQNDEETWTDQQKDNDNYKDKDKDNDKDIKRTLLKSDPRVLWPLRHLIGELRRQALTNKTGNEKDKDKDKDKDNDIYI